MLRYKIYKAIHYDARTGYAVIKVRKYKWRPKLKRYDLTEEKVELVGTMHAEPVPGDVIDAETEPKMDSRYGPQEKIITYKVIMPANLEGVATWLKARKGLGAKRIQQLLDKYGLDTISEIAADYKVLTAIGVPVQDARLIQDQAVAGSACYEELVNSLNKGKVDPTYALPLWKEYRERSTRIVRQEPWEAYYDGILPYDDAVRLIQRWGCDQAGMIKLSVMHYMDAVMDGIGIVCVNLPVLLAKLPELLANRSINTDKEAINEAVKELCQENRLRMDSHVNPGKTLIYKAAAYNAEISMAIRVAQLMDTYKPRMILKDDALKYLHDYKEIKLDAGQCEAVIKAVTSPMMILTGGPGTGKTSTLRAVVACAQDLEYAKVVLMAPTGKAADRMAAQIGLPARTIHSTLGLVEGLNKKPQKVDANWVIVDEASMIPDYLMDQLLTAIDLGAHVILVGDVDQLPPVGAGSPYQQIIKSGVVPAVSLTEIHRQAEGSGIVTAAQAIKQGQPIVYGDSVKAYAANLETITSQVCKAVEDALVAGYRLEDIQVLAPRKKGTDGILKLNRALQDALNPSNGSAVCYSDEKEFRVGDRVIHTRNDYDRGVMNGEVGTVKELCWIRSCALIVQYGDREVPYTMSQLQDLELAYAITVHKAQGSEYPVVVLPACGTGWHRKLLYTALTRASKCVYVVGATSVLDDAARDVKSEDRGSCLATRIAAKIATCSS